MSLNEAESDLRLQKVIRSAVVSGGRHFGKILKIEKIYVRESKPVDSVKFTHDIVMLYMSPESLLKHVEFFGTAIY